MRDTEEWRFFTVVIVEQPPRHVRYAVTHA